MQYYPTGHTLKAINLLSLKIIKKFEHFHVL